MIKNHVDGVEQIITKRDRTVAIVRDITNPFASLHRQLIEHQNHYNEGREVADYILKKPSDHDHLPFAAFIGGDEVPWSNAGYHFYSRMDRCDWLKSEILLIILKSGIIDPLENPINVAPWDRKVPYNGVTTTSTPDIYTQVNERSPTGAHLPIPQSCHEHPHRSQHQEYIGKSQSFQREYQGGAIVSEASRICFI